MSIKDIDRNLLEEVKKFKWRQNSYDSELLEKIYFIKILTGERVLLYYFINNLINLNYSIYFNFFSNLLSLLISEYFYHYLLFFTRTNTTCQSWLEKGGIQTSQHFFSTFQHSPD